ncbi:MAG: hypothetical protein M3Z54_11455, partial [Gemmatimonadota bacterium]|nr:hypothetical protein [Gemmatimonadota bacterium]
LVPLTRRPSVSISKPNHSRPLALPREPSRVRPVIGLFFLADLAHALLVARYFSLYATIAFDLMIAASLAWAFVLAAA